MSLSTFATPPPRPADSETDDADDMDDMIDGDRQLTTDSDAIDGGLNDSDLGSPRDTDLAADNGVGLNETR